MRRGQVAGESEGVFDAVLGAPEDGILAAGWNPNVERSPGAPTAALREREPSNGWTAVRG
jgi:hypothetical protein